MVGVSSRILRPEDQVVTRSRDAEGAKTNLLELFRFHAVRNLEVLEAEVVARFNIAVADQRVVAVGYA